MSAREDLHRAVAECLGLHAELGAYPERLPQVPQALRAEIAQQPERVSRTLTGVQPEERVAALESLNASLRRLGEAAP
jgi:hypothetical protein